MVKNYQEGKKMIKGVNKKVIEINNPQSLYFDKAVLYLKPNLSSISYKLLQAEAQELLCSLSPRQPRRFIGRLLPVITAAAAGFAGVLAAYFIIRLAG